MFIFRNLPVFFDGGEGGGGGGEGAGGAGGEGGGGQAPPEKPPWGEEDFDPKRAWDLIQNLRGDNATLKGERDEYKTKVQKHEDAGKDEKTKLEERATGAETRAKAAESASLKLDVAMEKAPDGMTVAQVRKLAKRLTGESREDLEKDADELFADFASSTNSDSTRRRPQERLKPGAKPNAEPEETDDPRKLAQRVPDNY